MVSAGSDGLVKMWDYRNGTCYCTLEEHTGKVWGIAERMDGEQAFLITGGTDSLIVLWKDVTVQQEAEALEERKETVRMEQVMQNEIKVGHYVEAALIAFKLKRPQGIYNIVQNMSSYEITNFVDGLVETPEGVTVLLTHIRDWNCYKKYTPMAQKLLFEVCERIPASQFPESKEILEGIITYSMKHFARAEKLYMDSFLVEHLMNEIALLPTKSVNEEDTTHKRAKIDIS